MKYDKYGNPNYVHEYNNKLVDIGDELAAIDDEEFDYKEMERTHIINPFFDHKLTDDNVHQVTDILTSDIIQKMGIVGYFLPRKYAGIDRVLGEAFDVSFKEAWQFSMIMQNYSSYNGMGSFFDYAGLRTNDEMTVMINPKMFRHQCGGIDPQVGDWVYFKMDNALFEVKYVDPYTKFYQYGNLSQKSMILSKVVYNQEDIEAEVQNADTFNLHDYEESDMDALHNLNGRMDVEFEEFADSDYMIKEADKSVTDMTTTRGNGIEFDKNVGELPKNSIEDINKLMGWK